jgi:hypothetical protein
VPIEPEIKPRLISSVLIWDLIDLHLSGNISKITQSSNIPRAVIELSVTTFEGKISRLL